MALPDGLQEVALGKGGNHIVHVGVIDGDEVGAGEEGAPGGGIDGAILGEGAVEGLELLNGAEGGGAKVAVNAKRGMGSASDKEKLDQYHFGAVVAVAKDVHDIE
jgi:hypothetical protein